MSCFEKSYGEGNVQGNISKHLNYIWKLVSCFDKSYGEGNVQGNISKHLNYIWNWCRALRNHMGKEMCKETFLNT